MWRMATLHCGLLSLLLVKKLVSLPPSYSRFRSCVTAKRCREGGRSLSWKCLCFQLLWKWHWKYLDMMSYCLCGQLPTGHMVHITSSKFDSVVGGSLSWSRCYNSVTELNVLHQSPEKLLDPKIASIQRQHLLFSVFIIPQRMAKNPTKQYN